MELLVFGHHGARVIVFPTSKGRFYEWEDRGMVGTLREHLERGWLQLYCLDSVDAESWYNWGAHPGYRAWRQHQYMEYVHNEVLPLTTAKNGNPFLITTGASFGAYHAMNFGLRFPWKVDRILAMSGIYDIRWWASGYHNDTVYFNNPAQFIEGEREEPRLGALRHQDIIIVVGNTDPLIEQSRRMSGLLWGKGVGNALREWDGWNHDWPYWQRMVQSYIGGKA
jgi:esterase/lipase superfamily enzyme